MKWTTLLLVENISKEVQDQIYSDSDIFRFKMLPFISLRKGHPWSNSRPAGLREIAFTKTSYALAWSINRALLEANHISRTWAPNGNRWVLGLDKPPGYYVAVKRGVFFNIVPLAIIEEMRIAHPAVISLSLQLRQGTKVTESHILSITTRFAAKSMPVVLAAGNWGAFGAGTLSPLAQLPWTIAVGATSDPEGTKLFSKSSIGEIGDKCGDGVTVVAFGENEFVPGNFGTSYAVPRVTQYLLVFTSFVLQLRAIEESMRTGQQGGVPLLQYISVDKGFKGFNPHPRKPLPMIPQLGVNKEALKSTLGIMQKGGLTLRIKPNPQVLRQMLIESAKAIEGYESHEVGYGFVSQTTTLDYLSRFTGKKLAELFFDKSDLNDSICEILCNYKLANSDELPALYDISVNSSLSYSIDYYTAEIQASMRDPEINPKETGFRKEQSNYYWPPSM